MRNVMLNNGVKMPILGLGTWRSEPQEVYGAIRWALKLGITHFDCAYIYGNEKEIGQAFHDAMVEDKIKREDLFITSKLWNNSHLYDDVELALDESLENLRLEYLDLYLMHWPVAQKKDSRMPLTKDDMLSLIDAPLDVTWKAMEEVYKKGKARAIGVSNFGINRLKNLIEKVEINPMVNQVECHPYLQQNELLEFLEHNNIVMTAYAPIGSGHRDLLANEVIKKIAKRNNISEVEVCLAWNMKRGVVVIPKSVNEKHISENIKALNVDLDDEDMKEIENIGKNERFLTADVFQIGVYENEDILG